MEKHLEEEHIQIEVMARVENVELLDVSKAEKRASLIRDYDYILKMSLRIKLSIGTEVICLEGDVYRTTSKQKPFEAGMFRHSPRKFQTSVTCPLCDNLVKKRDCEYFHYIHNQELFEFIQNHPDFRFIWLQYRHLC